MDDADLALRNLTYGWLADHGRTPTAAEAAQAAGLSRDQVAAGWRRLQAEHALVLDRVGEIRMAAPFSAVPTAFTVSAGGRRWHANCAWDAFGVCAALGVGGTITTACGDCGHAIEVTVRGERPDRGDLLFHCLVPAARWWDDIVFT